MISKSAFWGLILASFLFAVTDDFLRAESFRREATGSIAAVATVVPSSGLTLVADENEPTRTACAGYLESANSYAFAESTTFGLVRTGRSQLVQITVQAGETLIFHSQIGQSSIHPVILPGPAVGTALLDLRAMIQTADANHSLLAITLIALDQ